MVKLVILIKPQDDMQLFDAGWPQFLHKAEQMPGLQREATSQIDVMLYGEESYLMMHELFFDTQEEAQLAMSTPEGQSAGRILQQLTGGKLVLFFADYKEDDIENLRKYQQRGGETNLNDQA